MKRHEKPYGCTFANCKGSFGSKNDWKRHENSQHFQLDIWHCDVKGEGNPVNPECEKHYHRRESFQHHLKKCHGVQDEKVLEEKLNTCRMDRSRQTKFWCGFCRVMVDNKQHGLSGWNERYNHIESHLQGRDGFDKMTMLDWVPSEGPVDGDKQSDSSETTPGDDGAALDTTPDADIDAVTPHDTVSAPRKRPTEGGSPAPKRPRKRGSIQTMWICVRLSEFPSHVLSTPHPFLILCEANNTPAPLVQLPLLYDVQHFIGVLQLRRESLTL